MDFIRSICQCCPVRISAFQSQYSAVVPTNSIPSKMSECEECSVRFSILKRRKTCIDCRHDYCVTCMKKGKKAPHCHRCHILGTFPLNREAVTSLKVRHLRWFLEKNKVSMQGCKEKSDMVDLVMHHAALRNATFAYPQNYERHTVRPEDVPRSPVFESRNQQSSTSASTPSCPGPAPRHDIQAQEDEEDGFTLITLEESLGRLPGQNDLMEESGASVPDAGTGEPEIPEESGSTHNMQQEKVDDNTAAKGYAILSINDITSIDQISSLSVMQLKLILTRNFVGFKGCCEKQELQKKVCNLWIKKQESKGDDISDENLCKICMEAAIDSVLLDCGHLVTCTECGKQLHECPICRQYIVRVVHTFKA